MIISVLTEQYVALVSDRRTTWIDEGKIKRQEDTDTKTINLFGQFLMGFTGLARIGGFRIERWLLEILKDASTDQYFNVIHRETGAAFNRLQPPREIRHAFLAVGYASLEAGGEVHPLSVVISNSLDDYGRFSTAIAPTDFRMNVERLGNRRQLIQSVGWPMRETTSRALSHRIRAVTKGDAFNPKLSIGPLVMALRDTARRSREQVGNAMLFASLPRCSVPSIGMSMGLIDYKQQAASLFLPENAHRADDGAVYMPAMINPQMNIIGFKMYSGKHPGPLKHEEGF
jgi:hypothetical protein